jgi:lysophospholipase L1-like esterase
VLARYERDALSQAGVKFIVVCIGVNDIVFPGTFTPATEAVTSQSIIDAYRQLISRARQKGIRILFTTIPPFANARYSGNKTLVVYTTGKEVVRKQVNEWIRDSHESDGMIDFDAVLRDPDHLSHLLPEFDSGDHLHSNDAGYAATANAVPLELFQH